MKLDILFKNFVENGFNLFEKEFYAKRDDEIKSKHIFELKLAA